VIDIEEARALRDEILRVGARAIVLSLRNLRDIVRDNPNVLDVWRKDPIRCLDVMILTIELRHVDGVRDVEDAMAKRIAALTERTPR
jgi:hypothetical protein